MTDDDLTSPELDLATEDSENLDEIVREALQAVERHGGPESAEAEAPVSVSELHEELEDLRDRSARTLADFDNYRKRIQREREDERRYAEFDIVAELLGVMDNLERALTAKGSADDLKIGVEMILRQFQSLLNRHGAERVSADGEPFDPKIHEAVSRLEDPTVEHPMVCEELQAGYKMYDRLLRPAMVRVALPTDEVEESLEEAR